MQMTAKSSVDSVRREMIARMAIPLPPRREQDEIVKALKEADGLIVALEQFIEKKRLVKQGAMQELLSGRRRLPGFSGDWATKSLGDLCHMKSGEGITSARISRSGEFPCYGGNGLRGYTRTYTHNGQYTLIGRVGALCGNIITVQGKFFASEHAIVASASDAVDNLWLSYRLATMQLGKYSEASAQPVLTVSKLKKLELEVPLDKNEQQAIADVLSNMNAELAATEVRLEKARQIKQGMMQELLNGRVRLV